MNEEKRIAGIYVRVSTEEQSELNKQLDRIKTAYIKGIIKLDEV